MQTGYLKLVSGRPFDYPITSLCFVKPLGVIIIGLSNGSFYGWNPTSNDADMMTAHTWPITSMSINGQWLFSGDQQGGIAVRDCQNSFNKVLDGTIMTDISPGKKPEVTCMTLVINPNTGLPIIVAGDNVGQITLLSCDQQQQIINSTFLAHKTNPKGQANPIIYVFVIDFGLISLDIFGHFRLWIQN